MPKWMTAAFTLFLCLHVFKIQANTVDYVINMYINAMGGKDRLNSIRTLYTESVGVMDGSATTWKMYKINGAFCRMEISSREGRTLYKATGKKFLVPGPRNKFISESMTSVQMAFDWPGPLVGYVSKAHQTELVGKDNVHGKECYKIKLTLKSGGDIYYYIDATNGYILRETRNGINKGRDGDSEKTAGELSLDYSDYRKTTDGYVFPYTINLDAESIKVNYKKIVVNIPVTPAAAQLKEN